MKHIAELLVVGFIILVILGFIYLVNTGIAKKVLERDPEIKKLSAITAPGTVVELWKIKDQDSWCYIMLEIHENKFTQSVLNCH